MTDIGSGRRIIVYQKFTGARNGMKWNHLRKTKAQIECQDKNKRRKYTTLSGCRTLIPLLTHTHTLTRTHSQSGHRKRWFLLFLFYLNHTKYLRRFCVLWSKMYCPWRSKKVEKRNPNGCGKTRKVSAKRVCNMSSGLCGSRRSSPVRFGSVLSCPGALLSCLRRFCMRRRVCKISKCLTFCQDICLKQWHVLWWQPKTRRHQ